MSNFDNQFMVPLPPDHGRARAFFQRHLNGIISHPVCAFFFALYIACLLGVWFSSSEMFIILPVLALGWGFAAIGWWWAPNLSAAARIIWIIVSAIPLSGEGYVLYWHFHSKTVVAFHWPITFGPPTLPADPPDLPPLNLPGPPLSKSGKVMFLCQYPSHIDPRDSEAVKAEIRRNADILGNALGLSLVFNVIPYGFRFDVTANGTEGQLRMNGFQRMTIQVEGASTGLFVTLLMELPGGLAILSMMPVERNSEITSLLAKLAAQFTGVPEDKCRLL